jgi:hypothetical protein
MLTYCWFAAPSDLLVIIEGTLDGRECFYQQRGSTEYYEAMTLLVCNA